MVKICFVCHGNICRSPMAEFIMKQLAAQAGRQDEFEIVSKATHTDEIWNGVGSPIYPPAQAILRQKHIPFDDSKRATLLKQRDYDKFDIFIGMDRENMRAMPRIFGGDRDGKIRRLLDYTDAPRDVSDPWYTRDFETAWRDINEGCQGLFQKLMEGCV